MLLKYLDYLKQLDENEIEELLNYSFKYFSSNQSIQLENKYFINKNLKIGLSYLIRFYRSINTNKKIEDEQINNYLKDIFKGKNSQFHKILFENINLINNIQNKWIYFNIY